MASPKASAKGSGQIEELLTLKVQGNIINHFKCSNFICIFQEKHVKVSISCETEDHKAFDFELTLPSDELVALVQKAIVRLI